MAQVKSQITCYFIDLSETQESVLKAFFSQAIQKLLTPEEILQPLNWVMTLNQLKNCLQGEFAAFFQQRSEDRFFCVSPSYLNWNGLFPQEIEKEIQLVEDNFSQLKGLGLFLKNTENLIYEDQKDYLLLVPTKDNTGLELISKEGTIELGWENAPHKAQWLIPGNLIIGDWPQLPRKKLTEITPRKQVTRNLYPDWKQKAQFLSIGTARQKISENQKTIFETLDQYPGLGDTNALDFEQGLSGIRKRMLGANMQGLTDMKEDFLAVRFLGGRLQDVRDLETGKLLCSLSFCGLEWNKTEHGFRTQGAYSFEGDYSWGMRESLILEHKDLKIPGRMVIDYFFVEDSPEFFISLTVKWPEWNEPVTLSSLNIMRFDILDAPEAKELEINSYTPYSDIPGTRKVSSKEEELIFGTDFVFKTPDQSLVIGYPQNQIPRPYYLPWSHKKTLGKNKLCISPEGRWEPFSSNLVQGIQEHFTFYFSKCQKTKLPYKPTRKVALELIPPFIDNFS